MSGKMESLDAADALRQLAEEVEERAQEYEYVDLRVSLSWCDDYKWARPRPDTP